MVVTLHAQRSPVVRGARLLALRHVAVAGLASPHSKKARHVPGFFVCRTPVDAGQAHANRAATVSRRG